MKANIVADKNKKSELIKKFLLKSIDNFKIKKCNFFIVIGGDGFMLEVLKKNRKYKKSFYGINSGN